MQVIGVKDKVNLVNCLYRFDNENKKITTHLESHKLRLSVDNFIDYSEKIKFGSIDFQIINLSKIIIKQCYLDHLGVEISFLQPEMSWDP